MPVYVPAKVKQLNNDTYKLVDATDVDAGTIGVPIDVGAGGSIAADGILGEIAVQTGDGVPSHQAMAGTLYMDTSTGITYANQDGNTHWVAQGGSGGVIPIGAVTATILCLDSSGSPISGAQLYSSSDPAGNDNYTLVGITGADGNALCVLPTGLQYIWAFQSEEGFSNPVSLTVTVTPALPTPALTITGTATVPPITTVFIASNDELLAALGLTGIISAGDQALLNMLHPLAEQAIKNHPMVQNDLLFATHTEYLPIGRDHFQRTGLADYDMVGGLLTFSARFCRNDRLPLKHSPIWNDDTLQVFEQVGAYAGEAPNAFDEGVRSEVVVAQDVNGVRIPNATVWATSDAAGVNVVTPPSSCDASGEAIITIPSATTYVWFSQTGVVFPPAQVFPCDCQLIKGQDYYLDVENDSQCSMTGHLIRVYSVWPNEPRCIKVVYNGGWRTADFATGRAAGIKMAAIITATANFWKWKAKVDNDGKGAQVSESIGQHSESFNAEHVAAALGLFVDVPPEALSCMQSTLTCFNRYSA